MKVLVISDNPAINSGYGKIAAAFARHMKTKGHEIIFMASSQPQARFPFQPTDWEGCKVWPVPGYGNQEHVRHFLTTEKPDAILANADPRFFDYLFKMDNEIRRQCPLIFYHLWDDLPFPDYNMPFYNSCDHIICGSQFTYDLMTGHPDINDDAVDYVPIGFDPNIYHPLTTQEKTDFRTEFNTYTGNKHVNATFIVGTVGRHAERKQLLSIMETFDAWQKDKDDALLFVHSPGTDAGHSLEYAMRMRYRNSSIVFSNANPAQQTDELINKFYNLMDVLVNRSTAEGFGMPIAESMLAGTPAISINCPGPAGLITDDTGWLLSADVMPLYGNQVTPYIHTRYVTDEKFVAALDEAYYNKKMLQEKGAKCRDHILAQYSLKPVQQRFEDAVKKAVANWTPYPEFTVSAYPIPADSPKIMVPDEETR